MLKECRFEPFANWGNESKLSVAKEGMREPKKFIRKMKDRVHAISVIKEGFHCGCEIIYVSNDEWSSFLYYVQCDYCSIVNMSFQVNFKDMSSSVMPCFERKHAKGKEEKKIYFRALANSRLSRCIGSPMTAKKSPYVHSII